MGKKLVENQIVFKTLHVQYLRMIQPNDTVMRMTTRKAPDDTVQEAVREAIVEAWCALDDVKETAKHLQGDLHLLSHNISICTTICHWMQFSNFQRCTTRSRS